MYMIKQSANIGVDKSKTVLFFIIVLKLDNSTQSDLEVWQIGEYRKL